MKKEATLVMIGLILAACLAMALFWNSSLEDPFISFRYAQHVAHGDGLCWNHGEPPTEGYTNFLWVVLLSLPARLGLDLLLVAKLLGAMLFLILLVLIYLTGLALKLSARTTGAATFLLILTPAWSYYAASGLESMLFTVLVCGALLTHLRETGSDGPPYGSALLCLAATLTRPEGLGVWGLILILKFVAGGKKASWTAIWSAVYLLPLSLYLIWKQTYFGGLIPLPFFAKHTGNTVFLLYSGGLYIAQFVAMFAGPVMLLIVLLGSGKSGFWGSIKPDFRSDPRFQLLLFSALYPLYLLGTGGDVAAAFPSCRLLLPLGPIMILLLIHSLSACTNQLLVRRGIIVLLAIQAFSGLVQTEELVIFTRRINSYNGVSKSLFRLPGRPPITDFLIRDALERGWESPSIAVLAAGQIPFYSGFRSFDRLGLNDPIVAHSTKRQRGLDTKFDNDHLLALAPDYIQTNIPYQEVLTGEISPQWRLADQELWESEQFQTRYQLLTETPDRRAFFVRKESDPE